MPGLPKLYLRKRVRSAAGDVWEYLIVDPVSGAVESVIPDDIPTTADVKNVAEDVFDGLKSGVISIAQALGDIFSDLGSEIANATLDILKGGGIAIVDGIDNTYDYIREKLRGKEPDIIAAITVGFLSILTVRYLYKAVGRASNGSE